MRILYAIQATGNGHISRALEIGPSLDQVADVDYLLSGCQGDIAMHRPAAHRYHGASFIFGNNGGIDYWKTLRSAQPSQLIKDIRSIDLTQYDLVVNDFEPVTAWAAKQSTVPIVSVSHQAAVVSPAAPKPSGFYPIAKTILKNYAPVSDKVGLHFESYDEETLTPIIRSSIRECTTAEKDYVTVYLPAYSAEHILSSLAPLNDIRWRVFCKGLDSPVEKGHITLYPVGHDAWLRSFAEAHGVVLGAGFESPSEALLLGKRLLVIPMRNQYEQLCNVEALRRMGVWTTAALEPSRTGMLKEWLVSAPTVKKEYPDHTDAIISRALRCATVDQQGVRRELSTAL